MGMIWVLMIGFSVGAYSPPMVADITKDVKTEFGIYHPYPVDVTPSCTLYTIEPDFSNVINYKDFSFSPKEESLLSKNGFVATPSSYKEIYDIYNECKEKEIPVFVSGDAMLHTFHLLYDRILLTCETKKFFEDIENITDVLLEKSMEEYESAKDEKVKEAARYNVAYLSVVEELLDPAFSTPSYVKDLVDEELVLMDEHGGLRPSPIFGYTEDYSQYVPRGHYTKSDSLKVYFKALMWYGRMTFIIEDNGLIEGNVDSLIRESTRRAILITQLMNNTLIEGKPVMTLWERVYLPTVFFVGKTDDINIYQYTKIAKEIYGSNFTSLSVETFGDDSLLDEFLQKARKLPDPKIWTPTSKGFRFMGQRFIPDSYIFTELTFNRIGERALPKGLDVMSVLGSDRAYEILDKVYNETRYAGYAEKMAKLKEEFTALPDATWAENLYYNWLYCLMPLLFTKGEGFPFFMRHTAWLDKELDEALGSWTELRHDTILYAKQSYPAWGSFDFKGSGYVEPNPWLFARLASLVEFMKQGLDNLGLLLDDFKVRLKVFKSLQLRLKTIAEKELTNQLLSQGDYEFIANTGTFLQSLVNFDEGYHGSVGPPDSDDQLPVVVDVHTDPFSTNSCLEEGVGYPFFIYVIVDIGGELVITKGAIFSYFEFTQSLSDRLTDERWQEMLQTSPPDLPCWFESFVDLSQDFTINSPTHNNSAQTEYYGITEELQDLCTPLRLNVSPNPIKGRVEVKYSLKSKTPVSLEIYDLNGRLIRRLTDSYKTSGLHRVIWDCRDERGYRVPSGIYFLELDTREGSITKKIILLK